MIDAINKAWKYQLLTYPNPAVGCKIVKNNQILSISAHQKAGFAHAELQAIKEAYLKLYPNSDLKNIFNPFKINDFLIKNHNNFLKDCEVYVTLEPCSHIGKTPSCANLLATLKPKKIYIGSKDLNKVAKGGIEILQKAGIEVKVGVEKNKCDQLLYPFSRWMKDKFVFFKMAIRDDGSNDGIVSSNDSFKWVHQIRNILDLMVIGGNSVRIDRPTLDARLIKGKAPDILIYSNQTDFDKTIPLFKVPNRKITISDQLNFENNKFIMIEGGYNLYHSLQNQIDMLVIILSHTKKQKINLQKQFNKKIIHSYFINNIDEIVFLI
jgi:diaminohydroxyphosphoribosylaminopyrimidine deaminase/5-amino-6-(5-phosphoribosylamino)uracil reductase